LEEEEEKDGDDDPATHISKVGPCHLVPRAELGDHGRDDALVDGGNGREGKYGNGTPEEGDEKLDPLEVGGTLDAVGAKDGICLFGEDEGVVVVEAVDEGDDTDEDGLGTGLDVAVETIEEIEDEEHVEEENGLQFGSGDVVCIVRSLDHHLVEIDHYRKIDERYEKVGTKVLQHLLILFLNG
jgi:hypothetical protein